MSRRAEALYFRALRGILALCFLAYIGVFLASGAQKLQSFSAPRPAPGPTLSLRGLVLLEGESAAPGLYPEATRLPSGALLPNGERLSRAALYLPGAAEGRIEEGEALSAAALSDELSRPLPALQRPGARFVCGYAWVYAALCPEEAELSAGDTVRLRFEGLDRSLRAEALSVSPAEKGQRIVLFRLTEGEELWTSRSELRAELERPE